MWRPVVLSLRALSSFQPGRTMVLCLKTLLCLAAFFAWPFPTISVSAEAEAPVSREAFRIGDATQGTLLFRTRQQTTLIPAPLLKTDVQISVTGQVARATVEQHFTNPGNEWAEGIYVFPLPTHAAVDHLRMRIGPRVIEGMIKERAEAKQVYEKAKQQGQRASLLEQERPNIFTVSVSNIGPGEAITVELEYQETLHYDQGQLRLRFPMVVGPRYIPGKPQERGELETPVDGHGWAHDTDRVPDASRITPFVLTPPPQSSLHPPAPSLPGLASSHGDAPFPGLHPRHGPINPVSLTIDLAPGFPLERLESAYHAIRASTEPDGRTRIALEEGSVPADRDFELMWQPAAGHAPTAALFTEQKDGENFAMIMFMPPAPSALHRDRMPREAIFIIDTSGSMHGASIEQAKAALGLALSRLTPEDTFNVIQFNSVTKVLFPDPNPATRANVQQALRYVGNLTAQGGTEMLPALTRALDQPDPVGGAVKSPRLRQVIFLTDGAVGNEEELFSTIRRRLGESRLFTVGIGSAPNSHFMQKAAEFGRGSFTYIGNTTEVQEKMDALFRKVEHPALTEIRVELPSQTQVDMLPERVPDLYLGEPLILAVKADNLPETIRVTGRFGTAPWSSELSFRQAKSRDGLSVFWARRKIASLMDQHVNGAEPNPVRQAVLDVALKHHLVSRYTSLVAVDVTPVRPGDRTLHSHALPTNLPQGWDYTSVFGLPQTATSGRLQMLLGLIALLVGAGLTWMRAWARAV